jgi:HEAT repeat protein
MDIERQLNSIDVEARRAAVLMLARQDNEPEQPEKIRLLLRAMQDSSWRVRKTAVDILLDQYSIDSYIDGLIKLLYIEDNAGARNTAIESLTKLGNKVVNYLIDAFDTTNHDVRKFVIDIIGEIRDKKCVPLLVDALKDEDENVRASAVEHLGTMREPAAVDALIEIIKGKDLWTAYPAADALGLIGDRRAVPALVGALEKKALREPALKALGRLADSETLDNVVPFVEDRSGSVRQETLKSLEMMYHEGVPEEQFIAAFTKAFSERAVEVLLEQATKGKPGGRGSAILFLGIMRDDRALDPLLEMSADELHASEVKKALIFIGKENPQVLVPLFEREFPYMKRYICEIAAEVAAPVYFDILVNLLADEDGHVRGISAAGLANIGDQRSVEHIIKLFRDPYEDVQEAAIKALGKFKSGLNLEDIHKMLDSKNPMVRRNASLLLGEIALPDSVPALGFALKDEDVRVRRAVVSALSAIKTSTSVECLVRALADEDSDIRAAAALSLGSIGAAETVEHLCLLLTDSEEMVKVAAAKALGKISAGRAVPNLVELLADPNGFVKTAVIAALGKIGGVDSREALIRMLDAEDIEVKRTAITSLSGFENVETNLLPFLNDEDWASRVAAVEALGGRGDENIVRELGRVYDSEEDPVVRRTIERYLNV